jgi:23S rRNA (cytosine1962-C5)-methyltransferase
MKIISTPGWADYELLDTGEGMRLERFGKYILVRPDPQIIWQPHLSNDEWAKADAIFDIQGKAWINRNNVPAKWLMKYHDLSFWAELTPFKHTGVFPEQILQWDWIQEKIKTATKQPRVLNLFGYTGIASLAAAHAGAQVTHVDASKPTIAWAKLNQTASHLDTKPIRWILDDAIKFVQREVKRGVKYDAFIMDPPVYGHGPNGERWEFTESFPQLLSVVKLLFSDRPLFILINAYAISASSLMLENTLKDIVPKNKKDIEVGELALEEKGSGRLLSTGIFGRWANS